MSLTPGARVGSYEVLGSLGAGGMGEVYRARDLKLDRDVALKILPPAFATDPDRLARFDREAKTLAALNHPLIAQIYGIEDSTDVRALVMELVDGEDVSDMLASVLKSEPDWSALPADVPPAIKTMLQRCLIKDRRARIGDIAVVQFVLAEASTLGVGPPEGGPHIADHGPPKGGPYVGRLLPIATAVLITAAMTAIVAWRLSPRMEPRPISRFTIVLPPDQQLTNTGRQMLALSRDGKQMVYVANSRLYLRALSELQPRAIWSPNGERVAFQSDREGDLAIFAQRADGTGSVERLTKPDNGVAHIPESWSPDGRVITLSVVKDSMNTLSILTISDHMVAPFGNVQSIEPPGSVFSPDGRWLAYHVIRPEDRQRATSGGTFVQPFPATGGIYPAPSINRDFHPLWSHDGKELFYVPLAANGRVAAVRVLAQSGLTFGNPETFPAAVIAGRTSGLRRAFDVLPDGKLVGPVPLDQAAGEPGAESEIRIVLNWFDELKARVPAAH